MPDYEEYQNPKINMNKSGEQSAYGIMSRLLKRKVNGKEIDNDQRSARGGGEGNSWLGRMKIYYSQLLQILKKIHHKFLC